MQSNVLTTLHPMSSLPRHPVDHQAWHTAIFDLTHVERVHLPRATFLALHHAKECFDTPHPLVQQVVIGLGSEHQPVEYVLAHESEFFSRKALSVSIQCHVHGRCRLFPPKWNGNAGRLGRHEPLTLVRDSRVYFLFKRADKSHHFDGVTSGFPNVHHRRSRTQRTLDISLQYSLWYYHMRLQHVLRVGHAAASVGAGAYSLVSDDGALTYFDTAAERDNAEQRWIERGWIKPRPTPSTAPHTVEYTIYDKKNNWKRLVFTDYDEYLKAWAEIDNGVQRHTRDGGMEKWDRARRQWVRIPYE